MIAEVRRRETQGRRPQGYPAMHKVQSTPVETLEDMVSDRGSTLGNPAGLLNVRLDGNCSVDCRKKNRPAWRQAGENPALSVKPQRKGGAAIVAGHSERDIFHYREMPVILREVSLCLRCRRQYREVCGETQQPCIDS